VFLDDVTIKLRTRNVGILTKENALKYGVCGPTTRASGVPKDVRQDQAFGAYADLNVKAITPDIITGTVVGDVYDRIIVRLLEVKQSIEIIEQCIEGMPEGDITSEPKLVKLLSALKKAEGEGIGRTEAPRGECFHYVRMAAGEETLANWKVRAPTYSNLMPIPAMLIGGQIADVPIAFASIDPCISCTNRAMVTDLGKRKKYTLDNEDLHKLSIEKTRRLQANLVN